MYIEQIEYKGKTIHFFDYKKCKNKEEMLKMLEISGEYYKNAEGKILSLDDFTDSPASSEFMARARVLSNEVFQHKREKGAILGITGIKVLLLKTYNLFSQDKIVPFSKKEDALEYLIK